MQPQVGFRWPETLTENSEINVFIPQLLHEIEEMQTESLGKAMMQGQWPRGIFFWGTSFM